MGTMNVYMGGSAKLIAALAARGELPRWLGSGAERSIPLRPLVLMAVSGAVLLTGLVAGIGSTSDLVRATSALFIAVYVLAVVSGVRILSGRARVAAVSALVFVLALAVFSAGFLAVPAVVAGASVALRRALRPKCVGFAGSKPTSPHRPPLQPPALD